MLSCKVSTVQTLPLDTAHNLGLRISATGVLELLNSQKLTDLESCGVYLSYRDELVAGDGQDLGYFFFIIRGKFEVSKITPDSGKKRVLATLTGGECFGEMSFLLHTPASANVFAIGETYVWGIPHASLLDYISRHEGGAALAVSIASQLARRVIEGNTQILGASSALSAYFGRQARLAALKNVETPQSGDAARMEIPDDVFDAFARETLGLAPGEPLTDAMREDISQRIAKNDVDIIPWLESGAAGKALEVQLKFTPRRLPDSPLLSQGPPSRVVNVPQTRARIQPAQVMVPTESGPLPTIAFLGLLISLILLSGYFWTPSLSLETRQGILKTAGMDNDEPNNLLNAYFFRTTKESAAVEITAGTTVTTHIDLPKASLLETHMRLAGGAIGRSTIKAEIYAMPEGGVFDEDNPGTPLISGAAKLLPDERSYSMLKSTLPPGKYLLRLTGEDADNLLNARITLEHSIRY